MPIIGIICEYNPFHNGHIYHIKKIKEKYPNSLIILVLNGYFLQRGEISILTKEDKIKIALKYGIDLVVELPFLYGTQAADIFASKSLEILNEFRVNKIIFGSETNNIGLLQNIANTELNNDDYNEFVKKYLDQGYNYPTALAKALNLKDFKFKANDLLGISYVKAINKNNYNIIPETIKRTNDYKDTKSNSHIVSASNIREKIKNNINISSFVPTETPKMIKPINYDTLFLLLKHIIITSNDLNSYLDVDEGIDHRLKQIILKVDNYQDLVEKIKTKRYTYNKINRMLIHILIGLKKVDRETKLDYIKILGFNPKGQEYLKELKKEKKQLFQISKNSLIYEYELKAAAIYDLITRENTIEFENKKQPIIID